MRLADNRDLIGGLVLAAVGAGFLVAALGLEFGSARRMGPGFFPTIVGAAVLLLGLAIAALGLGQRAAIEKPELRPALFILAGIAAFGFVVPRFGLLPAVFVAVAVSAFADRSQHPLKIAGLAAVAAVAAWVVFSFALGLPVPAFRMSV